MARRKRSANSSRTFRSARPQHPAVAAVFETDEVLERILLHIDSESRVLVSQRISRNFKYTIKTSTKIGQKLFLRPATLAEYAQLVEVDEYDLNLGWTPYPLLRDLDEKQAERALEIRDRGDEAARVFLQGPSSYSKRSWRAEKSWRAEETWRQMHIAHFAMRPQGGELAVHIQARPYGFDDVECLTMRWTAIMPETLMGKLVEDMRTLLAKARAKEYKKEKARRAMERKLWAQSPDPYGEDDEGCDQGSYDREGWGDALSDHWGDKTDTSSDESMEDGNASEVEEIDSDWVSSLEVDSNEQNDYSKFQKGKDADNADEDDAELDGFVASDRELSSAPDSDSERSAIITEEESSEDESSEEEGEEEEDRSNVQREGEVQEEGDIQEEGEAQEVEGQENGDEEVQDEMIPEAVMKEDADGKA